MIAITIYRNSRREISGFDMAGHAGYAESGHDIVCAAVSVLVINTINAIETFTPDFSQSTESDDEESGTVSFRLNGTTSPQTQLLLKTMVLGLEAMNNDKQYRQYIDLKFEEV